MAKIVNISEIHPTLGFTEFDILEKYRSVRGQIDTGIIPYIVSELEVQDIDNETDWKLAEMKYRMMKGE